MNWILSQHLQRVQCLQINGQQHYGTEPLYLIFGVAVDFFGIKLSGKNLGVHGCHVLMI